jgi:DNA repair exonuclease SbcCD ATPase subunit
MTTGLDLSRLTALERQAEGAIAAGHRMGDDIDAATAEIARIHGEHRRQAAGDDRRARARAEADPALARAKSRLATLRERQRAVFDGAGDSKRLAMACREYAEKQVGAELAKLGAAVQAASARLSQTKGADATRDLEEELEQLRERRQTLLDQLGKNRPDYVGLAEGR